MLLFHARIDKKNVWDKIGEQFRQAEVAELADALGSGLSGRKVVRVQVPPSAPEKKTRESGSFCFKGGGAVV